MPDFLDAGKRGAAGPETGITVWIERIDGEYREMPGLCLTLPQAARLWGLPVPLCRALLGALVKRGRLRETPNGHYIRGW